MPFYKNWGLALVVIWFITFFVNWAVYVGDPFGLIFVELAATLAWLVANANGDYCLPYTELDRTVEKRG